MDEDNVSQMLGQVVQTMENLNHLFEEKILKLRQEGSDEEDLKRLEQGVLAMKDAGRIYLTWTDHFIQRLNQSEQLDTMLD